LLNDSVSCYDITASVVDEGMIMEHYWNDNDKRKAKYLEKTCPSVTFSTTNPTQTDWPSAQRTSRLTFDIPRRRMKRRNAKNEY
jgi:hypothetical protein